MGQGPSKEIAGQEMAHRVLSWPLANHSGCTALLSGRTAGVQAGQGVFGGFRLQFLSTALNEGDIRWGNEETWHMIPAKQGSKLAALVPGFAVCDPMGCNAATSKSQQQVTSTP